MKKIFKQLFIVLCLLAAPLGVNAQTIVFHLTGGEETTVSLPATFTVTPAGDKLVIDDGKGSVVELSKDDIMCVASGNQRIEVLDVSALAGLLRAKVPDGVEAVDLGLPSGTKWANMNVGATTESDYGLFFAWGETVGYSSSDTNDGRSFDWASYKWMTKGKSSWEWINKYQIKDNQTDGCWYDSNNQFIGDGKSTLDPTDDAAHANWGGEWYIPTIADIEELLNNTTSEWTTLKGVSGLKFTSKKNGKSIFLPAAGYRGSSRVYEQGKYCCYWSWTLHSTSAARNLFFNPDAGSVYTNGFDRSDGRSVRPVLRK